MDWISDPENYDYEYLDFNNDGSSINLSSQRGELLPEKYGRDTFQLGCAQLVVVAIQRWPKVICSLLLQKNTSNGTLVKCGLKIVLL